MGVLLHNTSLYYNETRQSVRETQRIKFESHGLYEIQSISGAVNLNDTDSEEPLDFVVEWGERQKVIKLEDMTASIGNNGRREVMYTLTL